MRRFLLPLFLLLCFKLAAQNPEFAGYNWSTFPAAAPIDTVKPVDGTVITLERHITDVYANKDNNFEEIRIFHRKIKVMTHDAINSYNKIYVPVNNVLEIMDIKARFISTDGRITELPKESIKQVENLDNKGNYNVFAIEGAETGGEIEYYYKLRCKYDAYGSFYMQGDEPRTNVQVMYVFPSKLEYMIKSYNGFPEFTASIDTMLDKTIMVASCKVIPSLKEEKYGAYKASLMRYEFTLAYNNYTGILRTYSFSKAGANIYENLYLLNKKEASAVKSLVKKMKFASLSEVEKIRGIEDWVKGEIAVSDELGYTPSIDQMIKLKQTSKYGATRLTVALLTEAGIKFDLISTCEQNEREFDPDYNGWNYLNDYLIYFPSTNKIIKPDDRIYRMGITPSDYQGSYGLFMHPVSYGENFKSLTYDIRQLPVDSYLNNGDSLFVRLTIDPEEMNLHAAINRVFSGEWAASYQAYWGFLTEEKQKEQISQIFNMGTENTTINSYNVIHARSEDIGINPIKWNVDLTAHSLVEQAGNDLIVKIGETIGAQTEMYQEASRKTPIVVFDLHNYYRKIVFQIPEGYSVSNMETLNMKVEMMNNGKLSCCFHSWYELKDNQLVIYSQEYYTEMRYPADRFEEFRKVINAAADFNKKTILLIKG